MALPITILTVGKLKNSHIESLENEYLKRLVLTKVKFVELKSLGGDVKKEGESVLKKIQEIKANTGDTEFILLCEDGNQYDGVQFSKKLFNFFYESNKKHLVFIIGGALGHSDELRSQVKTHWSLSNLTFPHQLVRLILAEQIYRAETIHTGHPYHH